jgi:hypothetical protein
MSEKYRLEDCSWTFERGRRETAMNYDILRRPRCVSAGRAVIPESKWIVSE